MPIPSTINEDIENGKSLVRSHRNMNGSATLHYTKNNQNIKIPLEPLVNKYYDFFANYMDEVDMILVMSVEPGFGGQGYLEKSTERIREVRRMIETSGRNIDLEVDGGIRLDNLKMVLDAGANVIVAGSAVFHGDIERNVREINKILEA